MRIDPETIQDKDERMRMMRIDLMNRYRSISITSQTQYLLRISEGLQTYATHFRQLQQDILVEPMKDMKETLKKKNLADVSCVNSRLGSKVLFRIFEANKKPRLPEPEIQTQQIQVAAGNCQIVRLNYQTSPPSS